MFEELDEDGSGELTLDEINAAPPDVMKSLFEIAGTEDITTLFEAWQELLCATRLYPIYYESQLCWAELPRLLNEVKYSNTGQKLKKAQKLFRFLGELGRNAN